MTAIQQIERFDTGFEFTLDAAPLGGYDVWLNGERIETRYTLATYYYTTQARTPPPLEFVAGWEDTESIYAGNDVRIQWQHFGATEYLVERSADGVDYARFGHVPANGNIHHTFQGPAVAGTAYYRVYAARWRGGALLKTSSPLACQVYHATIPLPPSVQVSVAGGAATLSEKSVLLGDVADLGAATGGALAIIDSGEGSLDADPTL